MPFLPVSRVTRDHRKRDLARSAFIEKLSSKLGKTGIARNGFSRKPATAQEQRKLKSRGLKFCKSEQRRTARMTQA
jgi:hypothetical protein